MTHKRKVRIPAPQRGPNRRAGENKPNETHAEARARTSLQPTVKAAVTIKEYSKAYGELNLTGLLNELSNQVQVAQGGGLVRAEMMLIAQAHTLDAIFNNLAIKASDGG
jgi:hypothetical protein